MPTGYTAGVADGSIATLREYALTCARGMGALITMRDEPFDAPIPERFEPRTAYADEKLTKARARLAEIAAMSDEECEAAQRAEIAERERLRREYIASQASRANRYQSMIAAVEAWSTEADGIRDFMLDQLHQSLDFDCGGEWAPDVDEPKTPGEWRSAKIEKLTSQIAWDEKSRAEEIARTESRNRWLAALHASLPDEGAA